MVKAVRVDIFFFQAEDGIRDGTVTGVQTCALPILGVGIMVADSLESARAEVESDPTVKAGLLKADVRPWFGAKGIGAHLAADAAASRSEERRVGKECRSRGSW